MCATDPSKVPALGLDKAEYIIDIIQLRSKDRYEPRAWFMPLEQDRAAIAVLGIDQDRLDVEDRAHVAGVQQRRYVAGGVAQHVDGVALGWRDLRRRRLRP